MLPAGVRLSARRIFLDGFALSVAFTFMFLLSAAADLTIWLSDYPPDIRAAVGGVETSGALFIAVGLTLGLILIGGPLASNWLLRRELGERFNFASAFVHTLALFWLVNLYDVAVIDWLILNTIRPDFLVFPGTEGLAGYDDYFYHFRESFLNWIPWGASLLLAGIIALVSVMTARS